MFRRVVLAGQAAADADAEDADIRYNPRGMKIMEDDTEKTEKTLLNKRLELKEQFLREEISAEEYSRLKEDIEHELELLEEKKEKELQNLEKKEEQEVTKQIPEYKHKVIFEGDKPEGDTERESKQLDEEDQDLESQEEEKQEEEQDVQKSDHKYRHEVIYANKTEEEGKQNVWKYVSAVLGLILIISLGMNINLYGSPSETDTDIVVDKPVNLGAAAVADTGQNKIAVSPEDDASIGPANAPVTIIEFSDYQCPFCARVEPTVKQILETYKGKVRFVYRDFPLSFHQNAQKAAEATECADEQSKFWEYHDLLFEKQSEWSSSGVAKLKEYASSLGLNTGQFEKCLDSGKYSAEVKKDFEDGQNAGVSGTPAFFVNGVAIVGAQPFNVFEQAIEQELK